MEPVYRDEDTYYDIPQQLFHEAREQFGFRDRSLVSRCVVHRLVSN